MTIKRSRSWSAPLPKLPRQVTRRRFLTGALMPGATSCRASRSDLRGGLCGPAVYKLGGTLCVGSGGEYCSVVSSQHFQPGCDIGCVIFARFQGKLQVGAQERGPEFGNQFLDSVTFASEAMPAEVTVKPGLAARPMRTFMGKRRIVAIRVLETLEWRHLDRIGGDAVKRAIPAVSDGGSQGCEELFRVLDAGHRVECRCSLRVINFRQAVDLLHIENRVPLEKRDFPVDFVARLFVGFFSLDAICVDDKRALLALADVGVKFRCLFEGHPDGSREGLCHGACPQRENVDSAVRLPVVAEWARNPSCRMFGVPRPNPRPHAFFQVADDLVGNPGVDVLLFGSLHCFSPLRAFKKPHSLVMERCCAGAARAVIGQPVCGWRQLYP